MLEIFGVLLKFSTFIKFNKFIFFGLFGVSVEYSGAEGCNRGNMPEELSGSFKRRSRLERSASVNDIDDRGWTLLHVYARKGDLKGVCSLFCFFSSLTLRVLGILHVCLHIYIYWFIVPLTLSMWFGLVIFLCELPLHFPFCILLVYEYVFSCEENPECLSIPFKKPNVEFFFNFCKL